MADEDSYKYRIAIASSDGETVNRHYGRADKFFIYLVDDEEGYSLIEERKVEPVCHDGSHMIPDMEKSAVKFMDCKYVIAAKIGAGANQHLVAKGITCMELPGSIDDAVTKVWKYNRIQNLFK